MAKDDVCELRLYVHHETGSAWLVSEDDDEDAAVWLPRSQCSRGEQLDRAGRQYEFSVPEWLALQKELL